MDDLYWFMGFYPLAIYDLWDDKNGFKGISWTIHDYPSGVAFEDFFPKGPVYPA